MTPPTSVHVSSMHAMRGLEKGVVQSVLYWSWAPACDEVPMPPGSWLDAPVTGPGPNFLNGPVRRPARPLVDLS
ncbi:MAG: hypothetical protein KF733_03145 [Fimbriimonadaceae bacterium]|nr:MAG: hypothetical protein KF733_03145 [Fimbriimonadaceae bacterium]